MYYPEGSGIVPISNDGVEDCSESEAVGYGSTDRGGAWDL